LGSDSIAEKRRALLELRLRRSQGLRSAEIGGRTAGRTAGISLSVAQQQIWFLDQCAPGLSTYLTAFPTRLRGDLDVVALRRSFSALVARHETLRTTYHLTADGLAGRVHPATDVSLPVIDLTEPSPSAAMDAVRRHAEQDARTPFDLATGPMLRLVLLRLGPADHVLLLTMHHICWDGWSTGVLTRDLGVLYQAFRTGVPPELSTVDIQYQDHTHWHAGWLRTTGRAGRQAEYWRRQLDGLPSVSLPVDRPRPALQTFRGTAFTRRFPGDLRDRLTAVAQAAGVSLFAVMLSGFLVVLRKHSGQTDLGVGTTVANRPRTSAEQLIGCFVNMVVLRAQVDDQAAFTTLARHVHETALDATEHGDLPFAEVVNAIRPPRDPSRNPLFQVAFTMQESGPATVLLPGLRDETLPVHGGTTRFDLACYVASIPDGLHVAFEYSTDLFDADRMERLLDDYRSVLEQASAAPDQPVADVEVAHVMAGSAAEADVGAESFVPQPAQADIEAVTECATAVLGGVTPADLFDSGLTSLGLVRLIGRIAARTGVTVPVAQAYQDPSVNGLAKLVARQSARTVVRFRDEGTGAPLCCVHPSGGSVFCYRELAARLPADQPVLAFQAPGIDDTEPVLTRVPDMAARYLSDLRVLRPTGPYRLAGWSFGGAVAFEMAVLLRNAGEVVESLVLMDSQVPRTGNAPGHAELVAAFLEDMALLHGQPVPAVDEDLATLPAAARLTVAVDTLVRAGLVPTDIGRAQMVRRIEVFMANVASLWDYRPSVYDGDVTLVAARRSDAGVAGWRRFMTGRVHIRQMDCDHYEMLRPPAAGTLLSILDR
jgi:thioesterase domain-containing protein/acyl carrier protein